MSGRPRKGPLITPLQAAWISDDVLDFCSLRCMWVSLAESLYANVVVLIDWEPLAKRVVCRHCGKKKKRLRTAYTKEIMFPLEPEAAVEVQDGL